jgi:hypothetical protein
LISLCRVLRISLENVRLFLIVVVESVEILTQEMASLLLLRLRSCFLHLLLTCVAYLLCQRVLPLSLSVYFHLW